MGSQNDDEVAQPTRRLPAEWEPHAATWLTWPHNEETWPGLHDRAVLAFARFVAAVRRYEPVRLLVPNEKTAIEVSSRSDLAGDFDLEISIVPTDDSWTRDFGPICVSTEKGLLATDWRFNSWGSKYPFERDDAAAAAMIRAAGLDAEFQTEVLEGGSIDTDGAGTVLTTRSCLLNDNRGHADAASVERLLKDRLGLQKTIWLDAGIVGDDTDGHVDDFARFVAESRIVLADEEDRSDPNCAALQSARRILESETDAQGRPFELIRLPMPEGVWHRGERLPASYANFYILNGAVLVPSYGCAADATARGILQDQFPDRTIELIDCQELVVGLGALHCLSMQVPA